MGDARLASWPNSNKNSQSQYAIIKQNLAKKKKKIDINSDYILSTKNQSEKQKKGLSVASWIKRDFEPKLGRKVLASGNAE